MYYIGIKQVQATPASRDGRPGYEVTYSDGYVSWSPGDVFERSYLPMGEKDVPQAEQLDVQYNDDKVTADMVSAFLRYGEVGTLGEKTTVLLAKLANDYELVESSACVDPQEYSQDVGMEICHDRVYNKIRALLGFVLCWARNGIKLRQ